MADCYQIADDKRELILARLAEILPAVDGVVSFARNDPSIVAGRTPAVLLLDGDEDPGVPEGWKKGRPAPFPMVASARPEIYVMIEGADGQTATLNAVQQAIIHAVMHDAALKALCLDGRMQYEGSQTATAEARGLEHEAGLNFTFTYILVPKPICDPLPLAEPVGDSLREQIMAAIARAVSAVEGVDGRFRRNDISVPEDLEAAAGFMLDGDETTDPAFVRANRPPTAPLVVIADPEVYVAVQTSPADVGPTLNRLRLMIVRAVLNDPLVTLLAGDGDVRYEGCQTGLALGRSMAGELGLKFSLRYVVTP